MLAVFALVCTFPAFSWSFWIVASILVSSCFVCFWIRGHEVSLHSMRACKTLPYGQLTTALVPTVPSPCFLLQSPRLEIHFLCLVCPYPLHDRRVVVGQACPDLVWVVYASLSLFIQFLTIARTRETLRYLIYPSLHRNSWDTVVSRDIVEEIMADQAWFLALLILFCSSPGILRQPPLLAKREKHFGTFSVHVRLTVLKLVSLEKEEEEEEERNNDFRFFQNSFSRLL